MVALQYAPDVFADDDLDVAAARHVLDRLLDGMPEVALAARPEDVRRAARRCVDTVVAARRRRERVGERPPLDAPTAARAVDASAGVTAARAELREAGDEALRWIGIGNLWGLGTLGATGALVFGADIDPAGRPVTMVVMAAAAGPCATALLALARRSAVSMRVAAARASWAEALSATGAATMGELHARRIAYEAWQRREREAVAAEAAAEEARLDWHRLVGATYTPADAPWLAIRLADVRAAQLRVLRALLAERMRPRPAPALEPSPEPEPAPSAEPAPAPDAGGDAFAPEPGFVERVPTAERWLGDALARLRGRSLRLWSRSS